MLAPQVEPGRTQAECSNSAFRCVGNFVGLTGNHSSMIHIHDLLSRANGHRQRPDLDEVARLGMDHDPLCQLALPLAVTTQVLMQKQLDASIEIDEVRRVPKAVALVGIDDEGEAFS